MADGQRGEGESERRGDGEGNELGRLKPWRTVSVARASRRGGVTVKGTSWGG